MILDQITRSLPQFVLGTVLLLNSCALLSQPGAPTLQSQTLDELSGLAVSHADPNLLWGHNDSGGGPELFRIGLQGEDLGRVRINGVNAVDWEDIAAFDWRGKPALLIADTGDNRAMRDFVTVYAVTDPGREGLARLLWRLDFRYPGGARDCEAVAVDPVDGTVILLSKREVPQHLYRLALPKTEPPVGITTAELLGEVHTLPAPTLADLVSNPGFGQFSGQPTAMDISRDGRFAVVVTYKQAYRYRRGEGQSWIDAFAATPETNKMPRLRQTESGAIAADGLSLFVSSEGKSAPLLRVPLPPP